MVFKRFLVLNYRQAVWLLYGGCSFVCRSVRNTGLLSTPLVLRIGGLAVHLACNHPFNLTSPRKLTKLPPWTGEQLNPPGGRHIRCLPPWRGKRPFYKERSRVFTPHNTLYKVLFKSHKHQCIDSLDKHSIQCIACFDLHINSVDKQDTIHNIQ